MAALLPCEKSVAFHLLNRKYCIAFVAGIVAEFADEGTVVQVFVLRSVFPCNV